MPGPVQTHTCKTPNVRAGTVSGQAHDLLNVIRERKRKPWLIEPTSWKMRCWDIVTCFALLWTASVTPYEVAFLETQWDALLLLDIIVNCIFALDMALQFFIMYESRDRHGGVLLVHDPRQIASRYIRGWLVVDLVSVAPFDLLSVCLMPTSQEYEDFEKLRGLRFVRVLRLLKLTRIARASRIVSRWQQNISFPMAYISMGKCCLLLAVGAHWSACLFGLVGMLQFQSTENSEDARNLRRSWIRNYADGALVMESDVITSAWEVYLVCVYWAVMTMTTIGYGDVVPAAWSEQLTCVLLMWVGGMLWAFCIGSVCGIIQSLEAETCRFQAVMDEVTVMLKDIPGDLKYRVRRFFHQTRHVKEVRANQLLLEQMSPRLQEEVARAMGQFCIDSIPWTDECSDEFVAALSKSLLPLVFDENEPIRPNLSKLQTHLWTPQVTRSRFFEPSPPTMYLLKSGVASRNGLLLRVGDVWGKDFILSNPVLRKHTPCLCITYVEALCLPRPLLFEILQCFPMDQVPIRRYAIRLALHRAIVRIAHVFRYQQEAGLWYEGAESPRSQRRLLVEESLNPWCQHRCATSSTSKDDQNPSVPPPFQVEGWDTSFYEEESGNQSPSHWPRLECLQKHLSEMNHRMGGGDDLVQLPLAGSTPREEHAHRFKGTWGGSAQSSRQGSKASTRHHYLGVSEKSPRGTPRSALSVPHQSCRVESLRVPSKRAAFAAGGSFVHELEVDPPRQLPIWNWKSTEETGSPECPSPSAMSLPEAISRAAKVPTSYAAGDYGKGHERLFLGLEGTVSDCLPRLLSRSDSSAAVLPQVQELHFSAEEGGGSQSASSRSKPARQVTICQLSPRSRLPLRRRRGLPWLLAKVRRWRKELAAKDAPGAAWILTREAELVVAAVIVLNCLVLALETDYGPGSRSPARPEVLLWLVLECIFVALFMGETFCRCRALGCDFWRSGWNLYDSVLLLLYLVDVAVLSSLPADVGWQIGSIGVFRCAGLLRLARLLRLFHIFQELSVVITALLAALRAILAVLVVWVLTCFSFAVMATQLLGHRATYKDALLREEMQMRWGSMMRSMYSLFLLASSLDGDLLDHASKAEANIWLLLVPFVVLTHLLVLNAAVGVVVCQILEAQNMFGGNQAAPHEALAASIQSAIYAAVQEQSSLRPKEAEESSEPHHDPWLTSTTISL